MSELVVISRYIINDTLTNALSGLCIFSLNFSVRLSIIRGRGLLRLEQARSELGTHFGKIL